MHYCNHFSKLVVALKSVERLSRNRELKITAYRHVSAICRRREVAGDVIFSPLIKSLDGSSVVNLEYVLPSVVSEIIRKDHFVMSKGVEVDIIVHMPYKN